MKQLQYKIVVAGINHGTEEEPDVELVIRPKKTFCPDDQFDSFYSIAKSEAYNGEVTVEELPDEETELTQLDRVEAQATYTAMMTDTLLEV